MSSTIVSSSPPQSYSHHPQQLHSSPQLQYQPSSQPAPTPHPSIAAANPVPLAVAAPQQTPMGPTQLPFYLPPNEQRIIELIAGLASQHNLSEYARSKFGERGCPAPYLPMSIGAPLHVQELRNRQACNVAQQSFFPAPRESKQSLHNDAIAPTDATMTVVELDSVDTSSGNVNDTTPTANQSQNSLLPIPDLAPTPIPPPLLRTRSEPALSPPHSPLLQQELSSAIASDLPRPTAPTRQHNFLGAVPPLAAVPIPLIVAPLDPAKPKTSDSHPINISYLIPPEMVRYISSHLAQAYPHSLFNESVSPDEDGTGGIIQFSLPPHLCFNAFLSYYPPFTPSFVPPRTPQAHGSGRPSAVAYQPFRVADGSMKLGRPTAGLNTKSAVSENDTSPTISLTVDQDVRDAISEALQPLARPTQHDDSAMRGRPRAPVGIAKPAVDEGPLPSLPYPLTASGRGLPVTTPPVQSPAPSPSVPATPTGPQIGNLLLSSCPGKKVRLTGPVKGRGAICRSVPQDLARIRSLGVGLIINCLDDTELAFLGAPWTEYQAAAGEVGLDVLRIPTPEGLAPLDTERLNRQLEWVIRNYTLKGVNVLVHCRGGVGRAGLVASSWAIKMGLCGPIAEALQFDVAAAPPAIPWATLIAHGVLRRESFDLVATVVKVMRRRRSIKAIETYEQARFLIDFVEHLREMLECQRGDTLQTDQLVAETTTPTRGSPAPSVGRNSEANTDDTLVEMGGLEPGEEDKTPIAGDFKIHFVDGSTHNEHPSVDVPMTQVA